MVWHEHGADLKPELFAALARPGFSVVRCSDEFAAVAHVCRAARDGRHIQPPILLILLLVDPLRLRSPVAVVESVARRAPGVVIWMYDLTSSPQLRTVRASDIAEWRRAELTPKPTAPTEPPTITVKASIPAPPQAPEPASLSVPSASVSPSSDSPIPEVPPSAHGMPTQKLLSDDELAMLLDIDPPSPDQSKGP